MYQLWIGDKNFSSWSLRVWLLMRVKQIPFQEQMCTFSPLDTRTQRYLSFSPTGKVPCLHDGNTVIWESLAIIETLAEHYPHVFPASAQARCWSRCAIAEMHAGFPHLRQDCPMNCTLDQPFTELSSALKNDLERMDALWQQGLERFGGPYLAGPDFTAVDAYFAPVAFRAKSYHLPFSQASQQWMERMIALPEMQQWAADAKQEILSQKPCMD
ncbi:glutathione S-transferase family protein [Acinetobacter sp. GSS19]|uniref:glutathione S-transferase family protein n=1 Tax=Acinetobacter sp. GSS19 TaxID=3020716 RepID=UPI00235EB54B|nr:glutathione S-transferase family protein [Acinetobacter sp. GSS19]